MSPFITTTNAFLYNFKAMARRKIFTTKHHVPHSRNFSHKLFCPSTVPHSACCDNVQLCICSQCMACPTGSFVNTTAAKVRNILVS